MRVGVQSGIMAGTGTWLRHLRILAADEAWSEAPRGYRCGRLTMKRLLVTNVSESSGGRPSFLLEGLDQSEILRTDRQMRGLDQEEAGAQAVMRQNPGGNPPQATRYRR
jgi:hypothetical protein